MSTVAQKNSALKSWIMAVTGLDSSHVIRRNAGGPRPIDAYAVFDSPYSVGQVGTDFVSEESVNDGTITRVHTAIKEAKSGIDIYGISGGELLDNLARSVGASVPRGILAAADLVFFRQSSTVYLAEQTDTGPVDRYRADFYFYTQSDLVETDYELQLVTAEIEVIDNAQNVLTGEMSVGELITEDEE